MPLRPGAAGQAVPCRHLAFADAAGHTRCTARAHHRTAEDGAAHEKLGFPDGWGIATQSLSAIKQPADPAAML